MGAFGENLRREREARGISLREISDHTKIGVRLLEAIEEERFDRLPGGVFNKSFVCQYASYLGLDEEQLAAEFVRLASAARVAREAVPFAKAAEVAQVQAPAEPSYLRIILLAVCLGVALAGISYGIYRFVRGPSSSGQVAEIPAEPGSASAGESGQGLAEVPGTFSSSSTVAAAGSEPRELAPALSAAIAETRGEPAAAAPTDTDTLRLQIDSTGTVWLSITADGEKQWQGTMQPQQTRRAQAGETLEVTIGDAGAVSLTLNGKQLPPVGPAGQVRTFTISANTLADSIP